MIKRFFCMLLLSLLCLCATAFASEPANIFVEIKDGLHIVTKVYEALPDDITEEYPSALKESPFELDGYSYTYFDTKVDEITDVETRQEVKTETVKTKDNDISVILQNFEANVDYDVDGFKGKLALEHGSAQTVVDGYTSKTITVTDTITILGLGSNDPSIIPKTSAKDGITLKLTGVDWVVQEIDAVDYNAVPTRYKAIASYSGSYTQKVPTGFITTVNYVGNVNKTTIKKVVYSVTYLGTAVPKPTPIPTQKPITIDDIPKNNDFKWWIVPLVVGLLTIIAAILAFIILYDNTLIYLKNAEEYRLIAKKRIKWNNPIVDLNGLDVTGKEVAINVKRQIAKRLFGRQIKTIAAGDFSVRCLVDKQNVDFWYVVSIPEVDADMKAETTE